MVVIRPLVRLRHREHAGVEPAGEEADELLVVGAPDPVVDTAVLGTEVGGAFEQHGAAGLTAFHRDRVLVRPAAVAFEDRLPHVAFLRDGRRQLRAQLLGRCGGAGRVVGAPGAGPGAGNVWWTLRPAAALRVEAADRRRENENQDKDES